MSWWLVARAVGIGVLAVSAVVGAFFAGREYGKRKQKQEDQKQKTENECPPPETRCKYCLQVMEGGSFGDGRKCTNCPAKYHRKCYEKINKCEECKKAFPGKTQANPSDELGDDPACLHCLDDLVPIFSCPHCGHESHKECVEGNMYACPVCHSDVSASVNEGSAPARETEAPRRRSKYGFKTE